MLNCYPFPILWLQQLFSCCSHRLAAEAQIYSQQGTNHITNFAIRYNLYVDILMHMYIDRTTIVQFRIFEMYKHIWFLCCTDITVYTQCISCVSARWQELELRFEKAVSGPQKDVFPSWRCHILDSQYATVLFHLISAVRCSEISFQEIAEDYIYIYR